jgi:hypothetical protein
MPGRTLSADNAKRLMQIRDATLRTLQDAGEAYGREPFTDEEYEQVAKLDDDDEAYKREVTKEAADCGLSVDEYYEKSCLPPDDGDTGLYSESLHRDQLRNADWGDDSPFSIEFERSEDRDTSVWDVLER